MSLEPDAVTQRQDAPGKRLLMEAALRLASSRRSLSSIGLRELAREAGLNPNTFYRHFADVDDLGLAIIRDIATQLRQPLRELRLEAAGRAPQLVPLADALTTSERTGAPVGPALARLAAEERAAARRRVESHARRVPVRLLFPLVFLVLPAFVVLTVVPGLAAGMARL